MSETNDVPSSAHPYGASPLNPDAVPEPAAPPTRGGPLGPIALALSGGGYRAAGFHLGALRFLHRTGLLGDVVALSTVSGGSIVGARWLRGLLRRESFASFFDSFGGFLKKTNVIRDALDDLTAHRAHAGVSHPSLIRCAAEVYARDEVLGGTTLGDVMEGDLPLDEVIVNSTEFHSGVDFRFRRSANPRSVVGNGNFPVPRDVAARVRLADAVAASSCFPSGFEPIVFPDHFQWPGADGLERARRDLGQKFAGGLPLMDGGIYDNQGVGSLMLAYGKEETPPLMLICDTTPPDARLYDYPAPRKRGFVRLWMVNVLAWTAFVAAVLSAVALTVAGWTEWREGGFAWREVLLYGIPLLFSLGVAGGMLWMRRTFKDVQARIKEMAHIDDAWNDLRSLTVPEAISLAELRLTSVIALTSSIFMKRVRGLIFNSLFQNERFHSRAVPTLVYQLAQDNALERRHPWMRPSAAVRERAARAANFPTTLWLNRPSDLDDLVGTGEATTCWSLLKHLLEKKEPLTPAEEELLTRLRVAWAELNGVASPAPVPAG